MASQTRTAWEITADGRSSVAAELEAIFARLPRPLSPAAPTASARTEPPRRGGLQLWVLLLGTVVLAALIGSLAFLTPMVRTPQVARTQPEKAAPLPAPAPIAPRTVTGPPAISPPPPIAQPKVVAAHALPQTHKKAPAPHHGHCSRYATQAWCLHGRIMAADDELRGAYNAAVRAGVDRHTLIDIRHDWKRLRGRANRDPQALIRGYALLTQALRAEKRRARR